MKNELLNELEQRGFVHQFSNLNGLNDALNLGKIGVYLGSDPTADSLHVGHLVPVMMMRLFQKYGHKTILLVGGATGRIGDPSGRDTGRPMLSEDDLNKNLDGLKKSYSKFISFDKDDKSPAIMVDNYEWMHGYSHLDFLAKFGTDFTVPRMLAMESVKRRLETGMTFLEFNYMTFQAVDFWELYKKHNCILQVCGADQWGNSIMGVELIRKKERTEVFVLSTALITDSNGNKIGKSAGNAVWVNEDKTSPYEYYQYFRNVSDDLVIKFLKLFTDLSLSEIAQYEKFEGSQLNEVKQKLAFLATELAHGTDNALMAEKTSNELFSGGNSESAPTIDFESKDGEISVIDFITEIDLVPSKSEARRTIVQGGLTIDDEKITDVNSALNLKSGQSLILRKGKKTYLKVNVK